MSADTTLDRFVQSRPLAVLTRLILGEIVSDDLDEVFENSRVRGYQRDLLYSQLTIAISEVVLGFCKSPNAAYNKLKDSLAVSKTAFYEKLKRVEPDVCRASVQHSYKKCCEMLSAIGYKPWEYIAGYKCKMIDGNHLEGCENRLKELRTTWATALPGTAVVVLDAGRQMPQDIFLIPDGHAQERIVFDQILKTIEPMDLMIADSHFCTIKLMLGVAAADACFIVRQHGSLKGKLCGERKFVSTTDTGKVYEQAIEISEGFVVRRITVELFEPTQDGDTTIHILCNLPKHVSAQRIAEVYRLRHDIEHIFFLAATTLVCEVPGLNYPPAALFVFCVAMMAINCRQVLFALLSDAHGDDEVEKVSHYSVASEIAQSYDGLLVAINEKEWQQLTPTTLHERMRYAIKVAKQFDISRHRKAVRGPKKPPPKKTAFKNGTHVSVQKVLNQRI